MPTFLRPGKHTVLPLSVMVVEIWYVDPVTLDTIFVGEITPLGDGRGVRVLSKYGLEVTETVGDGTARNASIATVNIKE